MSDSDDFDEILSEMMRMAGRLFDGSSGVALSQAAERSYEAADEVIDGRDSVTYILHLPGLSQDDFRVSVTTDEIEVKTDSFLKRNPLPTKVNPDTVESKYVNGVLSVRVKKA